MGWALHQREYLDYAEPLYTGGRFKDVFTKLKAIKKKAAEEIGRNAFCSRARDPAKTRALNYGAEPADALEFARYNRCEASTLYDKITT